MFIDMKSFKSSQTTLMMILAGIAIISANSDSIDEAMAFPHASLVLDPEEEHANNITIVLGHTSKPLTVNYQVYTMENII